MPDRIIRPRPPLGDYAERFYLPPRRRPIWSDLLAAIGLALAGAGIMLLLACLAGCCRPDKHRPIEFDATCVEEIPLEPEVWLSAERMSFLKGGDQK